MRGRYSLTAQKAKLALAYWTMAGVLILAGGGRWSLDRKLKRYFAIVL